MRDGQFQTRLVASSSAERPKKHETRTEKGTNQTIQYRRRRDRNHTRVQIPWTDHQRQRRRPPVRDNLKKARQRWARVSRVLIHDGATEKMMGKFYLAVVQSALLYGSKTWVLSKRMKGMLEGFHNRCARQMRRQFIRPDPENEGEWIAPPVAATLVAGGLLPLMTYIAKRKAQILVFAVDQSVPHLWQAIPTSLSGGNRLFSLKTL
jgi:hypothetical protein